MRKYRTHKDFIEEMNDINPNIEILSEYIRSDIKIKCKCKLDGYEWEARPFDLLRKHGCPNCKGVKRKNTKMFIEEMGKLNPNITILGEYKNNKTKIKCQCKLDGFIWEVRPNNLLSGNGCPLCSGRPNKDTEYFKKQMQQINPNINIIGEYINDSTKIKCKCLIDGFIWESKPNNLIHGSGCPLCAKRPNKDTEYFIKELKRKNPNVIVLGEYVNSKTKIECLCKKCNFKFKTIPGDLIRGIGCPNCKISKGERKIEEFLDKNNLIYKIQYRIHDCCNKKPLPFDFAIFYNDKLILIEYQGIQHYKAIDFANKGKEWANKCFLLNQKRDNIKRDYCKNNNINLLEIPYWIEDIEGYLKENLIPLLHQP